MLRRSSCTLALVLAACGAFAACGYTAPDYSDAQFRCDDTHPCPSGQVCVADLCQPPGTAIDAAGGGVDAQFSGIACGDDVCDLSDECCVDVISGTRCQAPGAFCSGPATVCDGPEDCPGEECCLSASFAGVCTAVGTCSGRTACHETTDCSGTDTCCNILTTAWRGCFDNCPT